MKRASERRAELFDVIEKTLLFKQIENQINSAIKKGEITISIEDKHLSPNEIAQMTTIRKYYKCNDYNVKYYGDRTEIKL